MLVEAEVGDQLLQLAVLLLEPLQTPQLADTEPTVHLLPAAERLLGNPIRRITSATGVPVSACFSANAICSSLYLVFFIVSSFLVARHKAGKLTFNLAEKTGRTSMIANPTRFAN